MNAISDQPLQGARVLIAEDDAILAFDLGMVLQKAGAKILGPTLTLSHTLSLAQSTSMSAAVLDVNVGRAGGDKDIAGRDNIRTSEVDEAVAIRVGLRLEIGRAHV